MKWRKQQLLQAHFVLNQNHTWWEVSRLNWTVEPATDWMLNEIYSSLLFQRQFQKFTSSLPLRLDRWTASWRPSFAMRSLRGTRRPKRTRPCPCRPPASRRTWTPSSWSHWSRRLSLPSWPAFITWLSSKEGRAKSTPWWPQQTAWTICAAWTPPGTPGCERGGAEGAGCRAGRDVVVLSGVFVCLLFFKHVTEKTAAVKCVLFICDGNHTDVSDSITLLWIHLLRGIKLKQRPWLSQWQFTQGLPLSRILTPGLIDDLFMKTQFLLPLIYFYNKMTRSLIYIASHAVVNLTRGLYKYWCRYHNEPLTQAKLWERSCRVLQLHLCHIHLHPEYFFPWKLFCPSNSLFLFKQKTV